MNVRRAAIAVVVSASAIGGASAQSLEPARVGITQEMSLTLGEAIQHTLASNPDLAAARVVIEQAAQDTVAAAGSFDPQISLQSTYLRQELPISSLIGGSASGSLQQRDFFFGPQFSGVIPASGTKYSASFSSRRMTSDNSFATLNPQYPSDLNFNITQPLFRGRAVDEPRRQLELARQNETLTDAQFRQRVMDITLQTELAYWDLSFSERNLEVQREGVALAREQVASNQRLVGQGLAAPVDVLEAQTQVAVLEQNVYAAQATLTRAENRLKTLMLPDRSSSIWTSALRPTTPPAAEESVESLDEAVRQAIATRPELAQAAIAATANETNKRFFLDQRKPQVDLVGAYTSSGLSGRAIPPGPNPFTGGFAPLISRLNALSGLQGLPPLAADFGNFGGGVPEGLTGGVGQSLSGLLNQSFPTVEVGVRIALPLRNRTAEARHASSVAEGRRIEIDRRRLEQGVEAEVRNALQAVQSARAVLASATEARRTAEEQYASEQRQFSAGTSTVFLVIQRQTAMITTRTQHARAEVDLNKSLAELRRATGQTLAAHNIAVR
jgi:HAE1 family hydrophobic/amphiphilic exporter-1